MDITYYSNNVIMNFSMIVSLILFSFLFFLFVTFIISRYKKKTFRVSLISSAVSILIPCYNEERNIENCLESIAASNYNFNLIEIIVIDDQSTDNSVKIIQNWMDNNHTINSKLIQGNHAGKSKTLNLGVNNASNELIITMDADIILGKDTIQKLVTPMADPSIAATNACAIISKPNTFIEYFQMIEFCLNNLIRTSFSSLFDNSIWFFGAVACYKKSILKEVGYFKTDTLTEDMDICLEMYNKHYKIVTVQTAVIETIPCPTIKSLFIQRMRWYYGALQTLFKNKNLLKKDKRSAPVIFLFFNQYWWTFFAFVFFPLTAYQVYYWFPNEGIFEAVSYIFRWFSLAGPFFVLYKIPEWGLNFLNIFGVTSGIITLIMSTAALSQFRGRIDFKTIISIFLYFPYTIIQDAIIVLAVIKYSISKNRYFIN